MHDVSDFQRPILPNAIAEEKVCGFTLSQDRKSATKIFIESQSGASYEITIPIDG